MSWIKRVAFPQKQSTSAMLLQPTCEIERSRQFDTQGEYPLRLGSCAELVGVALKEDAFEETLLAVVAEALVEPTRLELAEAEDVRDCARAAEEVQQRTRRGNGRNCMLLRRVARVLSTNVCGLTSVRTKKKKGMDSPELG